MKLLSFFAAIFLSLSVHAETLRINGPSLIGAEPNKPFIYLIPATGKPAHYKAEGLPTGLKVDDKTGIITGTPKRAGRYSVKIHVMDSHHQMVSKQWVFVVERKALALTPPLGWNPWYVWGCNIDDAKIRQAADLLVSTGLAAHGYNYINIDDCWAGKRDANGEMQPNAKFPDMKALTDYVHSKGLRIGIYTGPGKKTCAGYPASEGHVEQDVMTYAKWGFDFLKYDWCKAQPKDAPPYIAVYKEMSEILDRAPRSMVHMICQYGNGEPWKWGRQVGGHMWRTDHDLADDWAAVVRNGFDRVHLSDYARPNAWNDLDMLMVGKGNWPDKLGTYNIPNRPPRPTKLTLDEQQTHMALWSLLASPLLFSGDLSQMDPTTLELLTNDDMLDVNQDSLGIAGRQVVRNDKMIIVAKPLADKSVAVGMFNLDNSPQVLSLKLTDLGLASGHHLKLRNIWSKKDMHVHGKNLIKARVGAHGVFFFKMTVK